MFRILLFALLALVAWKGFEKYQQKQHSAQLDHMVSEFISPPSRSTPRNNVHHATAVMAASIARK